MRIHSLPLVLLIVCVFIQLPKSVQAQHSDKQEHSKQTDLRAFKRLVPYNKPATSVTNKGCIAIHQYNNGPLWAVKITNICSQKVQARLCAIVETFQGSYDSCRRQPGFLSTTDRIGYVYEGIPVERVLRGESYLIPGQSLNLTTAPKSLCAEELRSLNTVDKSQSRKHFLVADSGIRFCLDADGPLVYADPIRSLRLFVDYCRPQTILNKFCVIGYPHRDWCALGYREWATQEWPFFEVGTMRHGLPSKTRCRTQESVDDSESAGFLFNLGRSYTGW